MSLYNRDAEVKRQAQIARLSNETAKQHVRNLYYERDRALLKVIERTHREANDRLHNRWSNKSLYYDQPFPSDIEIDIDCIVFQARETEKRAKVVRDDYDRKIDKAIAVAVRAEARDRSKMARAENITRAFGAQ